MKVYFNYIVDSSTNSYLIVNDDPNVREAILVDPVQLTERIIAQIEDGSYKLTAVLITHNHNHHVKGLDTLLKIYDPKIYGADSKFYNERSVILNGDGIIDIAGFDVEYFSVPGHSPDCMVYKIGDAVFTGDTLLAGVTSSTLTNYSKNLLNQKIKDKLFSLPDRTVVFPGHGVMTTIESEKMFNIDLLGSE